MNASPDRSAMRKQQEADLLERLKRAVADVMELGLPVQQVKRTRKVPDARLTAALAAAGWQSRVKNKPGPRRRTFGNGKRKGTQLPPARSDNQS